MIFFFFMNGASFILVFYILGLIFNVKMLLLSLYIILQILKILRECQRVLD